MAQECGCAGVVASANEVAPIKAGLGPNFQVLTPGIRPEGASSDDQKRIATPRDALRLGADYLIVGRPIIKADDPVASTRRIIDDIERTSAS